MTKPGKSKYTAKLKKEKVELSNKNIIEKVEHVAPRPSTTLLPEETQRHINKLQKILAISSMSIYIIAILATFGLIYFIGFGYMSGLAEDFVYWLGGATIGQLSGLLFIVYKSVFGKSRINQ